MDWWLAWVVAGVLVVLPFLLLVAFHRSDVTDSRGRRLDRRWRARRGKLSL